MASPGGGTPGARSAPGVTPARTVNPESGAFRCDPERGWGPGYIICVPGKGASVNRENPGQNELFN